MAIITEVRSREIYRDRQAAQLDKSASAFSEYPEDDDDVPIRFLNYTYTDTDPSRSAEKPLNIP